MAELGPIIVRALECILCGFMTITHREEETTCHECGGPTNVDCEIEVHFGEGC